MVTMGYHKATQARYYERHKEKINKKRNDYQKLMRRIARKAISDGLLKKDDVKI